MTPAVEVSRAAVFRAVGCFLALLGLAACSASAAGQDRASWFRFGRGSSVKVSVDTDTLDADGKVVSSTHSETVTTLVDWTPRKVTLRVVTVVTVAGKRLESPPQLVEIGPFGESIGEQSTVKTLPAEKIAVDQETLDCTVQEVEIRGPEARRTIRLASHSHTEPFEVRRVVTQFDPRDEVVSTTTTEVVEIDRPRRIVQLGDRPTTRVRTTYKNHKVSTTTEAVLSDEVPGFVVSSVTKEFDVAGKEVRRSTLAVTEFKAVEPEDRRLTRAQRRAARHNRR